MIIRGFTPRDFEELKRIYHDSGYSADYTFDVFNDPHYLGSFAVVDSDSKIITAGGLRLVPEAVLATDKSRSPRTKREALLKVLEVCRFLTQRDNHQGFTASTDDLKWYNQLLKYGFKPSKGKPLYHSVLAKD